DRQAARAIETTGRCRDHRHRRNGLWLLSAKTESSSLAAEASETNAEALQQAEMNSGLRWNGGARHVG
ncbi:MAG: hypothetical protein KJS83_11240, partial [Xanthomonadaceae bacterium]|nr:hypothetical protein [Xanthomonadaceae bacterium]